MERVVAQKWKICRRSVKLLAVLRSSNTANGDVKYTTSENVEDRIRM